MNSDNTNTTSVVIIDTIKAAIPIGGGSALTLLHSADVAITFATHVIGLLASIVGLTWYVIRLRKDLRSAPKTPT